MGVPSLVCHLDNIGPMTARTRTRPANHRRPLKLHVISAPLCYLQRVLFVCMPWKSLRPLARAKHGTSRPTSRPWGPQEPRRRRRAGFCGVRCRWMRGSDEALFSTRWQRQKQRRILLPSLPCSSAALHGRRSPPAMALVTLQRSPTPSAASSASSSAGEVSGKVGGRDLCEEALLHEQIQCVATNILQVTSACVFCALDRVLFR